MRYYYAVFKESKKAVEVEFPDLKGCATFGATFDEAYENAVDVLAGWLANAEEQFIKEPSQSKDLKGCRGKIIPVPVEPTILRSYEQSKRFNVIFPKTVLEKLDNYRKKKGMKRSSLLRQAVEEYMNKH